MSLLLDTLASYTPWLVNRHFVENPAPLKEPLFERFPAAVFFTDISGVTRLSITLSKQSQSAEELTRILNAYFGTLIELVASHGGDVVKFAGDGLYAVWPTIAHQETLETVTRRAVQCALIVQRRLSNYPTPTGQQLSMRIGIGAGDVLTATVGGVLKRWEFLLAGQPVGQVNRASEIGSPGDVALSPAAWELVQDYCTATPIADSHMKLERVNREIPPRLLPSPALPEAAVAGLQGFVSGAILARLDAGQVEWLAENRRVTVLFLKIASLSESTPDVAERLQEVMQAMQITLYHYEGSVRQFIMDDKGTVFIAAFGLPPRTHEDDPARGVRAALALHQKLNELDLESAVGVATGSVFCGPLGSRLRREYAMVGDIVYLSARLMVAARSGVLCDENTYQATNRQLKYIAVPPIQVKNHAEPVKVYLPQGKAQIEDSLRPIIGRVEERELLAQQLEALGRGESALLVLEGEAGIGKSRLVADLMQQAEARRFQVMVGEGDAVDQTTPYHGWRGVFSQMFHMDSFTQTRSRSMAIAARLATDPELVRLSPLLKSLLPIDIPENEFTESMTGDARAENTRTLLLRLLQLNSEKSHSIMILENAQWFDSASWSLALAVRQQIKSVMLVIVTRPLLDLPPHFAQMLESDQPTTMIHLPPLSEEEITTLICQRLEVAILPPNVAALIHQKSGGNPFFSEQLTYSLRDSGYVELVDGECRVAPTVGALLGLNIPDTIQGVITSRIDRLTPQQQFALKVASVIGQTFLYRTLYDVYPLKNERDNLRDYLRVLEKLDLIVVQTPEPDLSFHFKHIATQEVAANLMLFSQRRELHEAVARWYERNFVYDLAPFYALLAHHWENAQSNSKAVEYLEKAAQKALRDGMYREVIDCLDRAARLEPGNTSRQVRWATYAGEAHWGLGQLHQSQLEAEKALEMLGWPMPSARRDLMVGVVNQAIRQAFHRLFPRYFIGRTEENAANLLSAVRAYLRLQEVLYISNERLPLFYAGFRGLNLAERAGGDTPELARAYANGTVGLGILKQHRQAHWYTNRALAVTAKLNNPQITAHVSSRLGIYYTGVGRWDEARNTFDAAIRLYSSVGDERGVGDSLSAFALAEYMNGQFKHSQSLYELLDKTAMRSNNHEHLAWSMVGRGAIELAFSNFDTAVVLLETGCDLLARTIDRLSLIHSLGILALAYLYDGKLARAEELATSTAELIKKTTPTGYVAFGGYVGIAEVFLELWQSSGDIRYRTPAGESLKQLRRYARTFPVGMPRFWLLTGRYHWLNRAPRKAFAAWRKSLKLAESMNMPYEKALAHGIIGLNLPEDNAEHRSHLAQAAILLEQVSLPTPVRRR